MRLCRDCKHLKYKQVGYITTVYWCGISKKKKNGLKLGVHPWLDKSHPKCPIAKVRKER